MPSNTSARSRVLRHTSSSTTKHGLAVMSASADGPDVTAAVLADALRGRMSTLAKAAGCTCKISLPDTCASTLLYHSPCNLSMSLFFLVVFTAAWPMPLQTIIGNQAVPWGINFTKSYNIWENSWCCAQDQCTRPFITKNCQGFYASVNGMMIERQVPWWNNALRVLHAGLQHLHKGWDQATYLLALWSCTPIF